MSEPITPEATEQLLADADNWRYFVNESSNSKSLASDLAAHLSFYREEAAKWGTSSQVWR